MTENAPSPLLDPARVARLLGPAACRFDVEAKAECASTNSELMERAGGSGGAPSGSVLVADVQTAGRGRRGRSWQSAPGAGLTFSLLWRFDRPMAAMAGLSLAVGLGVARALDHLGVDDVALKWPNDLLRPADGAAWGKLGGILVELTMDAGGTLAVIGIGLNLDSPPQNIAAPLPPIGMGRLGRPAPERHALLAAVLAELATVLDVFATAGLPPLQAAWQARHAFQAARVRIEQDGEVQAEGRCLGIAPDGALLIETGGRTTRWMTGDLSLRLEEAGQ